MRLVDLEIKQKKDLKTNFDQRRNSVKTALAGTRAAAGHSFSL